MDGCVKSIGDSVGGLVWVRRRNGSWWPGRIVKADELPETVAVPVRSSTPVRLLGHGDSSVDWYNLERSKRVKPFRCGEYDVYIEKAKATAGTIRNAEKYVRRNDAILEALQIENACLGKDPLEFRPRVFKPGGRRSKSAREPPSKSHNIQADICNGVEDSDSEDSGHSIIDLSLSYENNGRGLKVQLEMGKRQRTSNDSEDDLAEGYKRMRGLEDLGMGVVSKRNAAVGGEDELVHGDSSPLFDSNAGNLMSNGSPVNSRRSFLSSRKRRSPVAYGNETSKRKDRRRPLTKLLENTAVVGVPATCDRLPCPSSIPLQMKGAMTSNMSTVAENYSSDSLFEGPSIAEEKYCADIISYSSGEPHVGVVGMQYSKNCQTGTKSLSEGVNEYVLTNPADFKSVGEGTSKWQSKGKRNSRHISKDMKSRSDKYMDLDEYDAELAGMELSDEFSLGLVANVNCSGMVGSLVAHNSKIRGKSKAANQLDSFQDREMQISRRGSHMRELISMPQPIEDTLRPQRVLPYRHSRMMVPSRYRDPDSPGRDFPTNSQTFDVSVGVGPHYRPQHPLVSLTSTFNGESIIGHPVTVEILDDSLSGNQGRHEIDAIIVSGRVHANMAYTGKPLSEAEKISKRISALRQHRPNNKSPKHKKSGLQPRTRKLSSLTKHKLVDDRNSLLVKCVSPAIACVPAKVVFSRISNALKGPPRRARNTETVIRTQRPAHVNISEAVDKPAISVQDNIMGAVSRSPKPAKTNIIESVNRSHRGAEKIVYPRIIEAVSGSPTPAQRA